MHDATRVKALLAKNHGEVKAKRLWHLRCQCETIIKYRGGERHPPPCGHVAACPKCKCSKCICWRALGRKRSGDIHLSHCPEHPDYGKDKS